MKKVNYFDLGLYRAAELKGIVNDIFPSLNIKKYSVYGFEACKVHYESIYPLFENNKHVTIYNKAISDSEQTVKLYYSWQNGEGHSLFDTKKNVDKDKFELVDSICFSKWLKNHVKDFKDSFNILRLNIEGAEWKLFKDLVENDLIKHFDIICGDANDVKKIGEYKTQIKEYYNFLEKNNIKVHSFCKVRKKDFNSIKKLIEKKWQK